MKSLTFFFFVILSFSFPNDSSFELEVEPAWKLVSSDGGLSVYKRDKAGSKYKEIKVESILDASVDDVLAAVVKADNYKNWIYKCAESEKIKTLNDNEFIYYTRADLPSPLWDRDIVARSTYRFDGGIHYFSSKEALGEVEEKSKAVRVKEFNTFWIIKDMGGNRTSVENRLHFEPGGSIPSWLVNLSIARGPKKTMMNFRKLVSEQ
jgi:ribosome-associated toxin RatA of RatAB toxin-antitoxin module